MELNRKSKDHLKKILVIEDSADISFTLKELLEFEGYLVDIASNGKEALDLLESNPNNLPHLILLDLMMPIMDGFQFRKIQQENQKFSNIPVVVMTADGNIVEKTTRLGASGFLKKPVDIDHILAVVKRFILS